MNARPVKIGTRTIAVADDQPTFWEKVAAGAWEPGTLAVIDRFVDEDTAFLDLGAWVGPTALYAAGRANRVIAVEADPAALDQLRRNLGANPELASRIEVIARAVHADPGVITLGARRKPGDSMSSTLLAGTARRWHAATVTPEELVSRLDATERLFVKLDIEGGEYALLPAAAALIARAETVLVSFHPTILAQTIPDTRDAARRLRDAVRPLAGFTARPLTERGAGWRSPAPMLVRLGLLGRLPANEWLFTR
jgi:FkbM family methyltransferase